MPSLASHFYRFMMRRAGVFQSPNGSIPELRGRIDRAIRLAKPPRETKILPVDAGGVPAEWEIPTGVPDDRVILYIHGGAWIICSPATHRNMVSQLARDAGMKVLSIDYRLAPEYPFPAALEDCLTAYRWLVGQGFPASHIAIAGDSAGGNLTLATLLALRDAGDPLPAAAVCLSPATDLANTGESQRTRRSVDVLLGSTTRGVGSLKVIEKYAADHNVREPYLSPLYGDLHSLPPILIHVGDHEILLDDSVRFVERACAAGVDAKIVVWPKMWHVFQMHAPVMPESKESLRQLGAFIRLHLV
jgi:epsilon-lactone hydrolase